MIKKFKYICTVGIAVFASFNTLAESADNYVLNQTSTKVIKNKSHPHYFAPYNTLVDKSSLVSYPRVLGNNEGLHYISGNNPIYIDAPLTQNKWSIYHPIKTYTREVEKNSIHMVSLKKVAEAELIQNINGIAEVKITKQLQEIKNNDVLFPIMSVENQQYSNIASIKKYKVVINPDSSATVKSNSKKEIVVHDLTEKVISHFDQKTYAGHSDVIIVGQGSNDGINVGDMISIYKDQNINKNNVTKFERARVKLLSISEENASLLPREKLASLTVINSYPFFSLAVVSEAEKPLLTSMEVSPFG